MSSSQPSKDSPCSSMTAMDRLLLLETWSRSGLSTKDFSRIVNLSSQRLSAWRRRFEKDGPAGLEDAKKGAPKGSRLPEPTKRAILLMKETHSDWGVDRIHDMLLRTEGFRASANAITRVLKEEGYEAVMAPTKRHPDKVRRFERARPNQMWQSDLFNFTLPPNSRRVYVVAFLDSCGGLCNGELSRRIPRSSWPSQLTVSTLLGLVAFGRRRWWRLERSLRCSPQCSLGHTPATRPYPFWVDTSKASAPGSIPRAIRETRSRGACEPLRRLIRCYAGAGSVLSTS